jgi:hypothetical protein
LDADKASYNAGRPVSPEARSMSRRAKAVARRATVVSPLKGIATAI